MNFDAIILIYIPFYWSNLCNSLDNEARLFIELNFTFTFKNCINSFPLFSYCFQE